MASGLKRTVKGDVAKLLASTAFNNRAVFPGVAGFITVAIDDRLISGNYSTPLTSNVEGIRDGWRGEYHFDKTISIF